MQWVQLSADEEASLAFVHQDLHLLAWAREEMIVAKTGEKIGSHAKALEARCRELAPERFVIEEKHRHDGLVVAVWDAVTKGERYGMAVPTKLDARTRHGLLWHAHRSLWEVMRRAG